jgi:RES domain-containing protein
MVNQAYASTIDDIGPSFIYGGRYNPRNEFGVLYLSSSEDCPVLERLRQVKGRRDNLLPQRVADFNVKIQKCLDLLSRDTLKILGISREDLVRDADFSVPQGVSREARNVGFEGLIAPSAAGEECSTLVVFKDKLSPPSFCALKQTSVKPYSID